MNYARTLSGDSVHSRPSSGDGGTFRVIPIYDWVQGQFGQHFNVLRQCTEDVAEGQRSDEMGVLVLPTLERNSGPLYFAKIEYC